MSLSLTSYAPVLAGTSANNLPADQKVAELVPLWEKILKESNGVVWLTSVEKSYADLATGA